MNKYRIAQIIILLAMVYFLLMGYFFILIKGIHGDFETNVSGNGFESQISFITPIPKLKKISFSLPIIEQVTLMEEKVRNVNSHSLDFTYYLNDFDKTPRKFHVSLISKQYEYSQKIKEKIKDALIKKKEFKCELFSLNIPEIRKAVLICFASSAIMIVLFIVIVILEKKEKNKIKQSDITEENSPNNINNSIIK